MGKLFDLDSPVMRAINKVADLMGLNFLVILCSLPIVTAGAAITAGHYVALKLVRDEESYIIKNFFKAFKQNFRQSTVIWVIILVGLSVLGYDFYLINHSEVLENPDVLWMLMMAVTVLLSFFLVWVFPLQAKFDNPVSRTIKNAFGMALIKFPRSLAMVICYITPWLAAYYITQSIPFMILLGVSGPMYLSALIYNKEFKNIEDRILERIAKEKGAEEDSNTEDEDRIFSDTLTINETER